MSEEASTSPNQAESQRPISSVTADEIDQVILDAPIRAYEQFETFELSALYHKAAAAAKEGGRDVEYLVYSLLAALMDLHFKPADRAEPFGPRFVFQNRRSLILADIPVELVTALADHVSGIKHPVVRARIADVSWMVCRRLGAAAHMAIEAYCETAERVGANTPDNKEANRGVKEYEVVGMLRRAIQIAEQTQGKQPFPVRLTTLIVNTRKDAFVRKNLFVFSEAAELDREFRISPTLEIAKEAEALADGIPASSNGYLPLAIMQLASQAFRTVRDSDN